MQALLSLKAGAEAEVHALVWWGVLLPTSTLAAASAQGPAQQQERTGKHSGHGLACTPTPALLCNHARSSASEHIRTRRDLAGAGGPQLEGRVADQRLLGSENIVMVVVDRPAQAPCQSLHNSAV